MVNRACSDNVKKRKKWLAAEEQLKLAARDYQYRQNSGNKKSLRDVAATFGVSYRTLARRVNGEGQSMLQSKENSQILTVTEEAVLADFIIESADRGFPLNHGQITTHANAILRSRQGPDCALVGQQWIFNFLDRHHDKLQTHWSKALDTQRAKSLNPAAVTSWFDIVEEYIARPGIRKEDIYGMDESGFPTAYTGQNRVAGRRGTKTQHKQGGADRENVTGIITICADGTTVNPMIIFKGKNFMQKWNNDNVANAFISHSENGWTDGTLGYQWLIKVFDPLTRECAAGRPRVLILDGHSSHYTSEFLKYSKENNIIVLGYPPHCTHALQGLDVVCFGKMKETWKKTISEFEEDQGHAVTRDDFTFLFGTAYNAAFDAETIKAAFRVTGVYPFSREVITAEQMKPSLATSTRGEFPLLQPSPVRAVLAAFDPNPSTPVRQSASAQAAEAHSASPLQRRRDPNIDPELYTPSKRIRTLYRAVESTSSGSFLVSKNQINSRIAIIEPVLERVPDHFPQPNWDLATTPSNVYRSRETLAIENEQMRAALKSAKLHMHARDMIIEGANAQLVVQNMHLHKTMAALNKRENKKKNDRSLLFDGKAQVLSSDEFRAKVDEQLARKEAEAAQRLKNVEGRKARKEAHRLNEEQWRQIKANHEEQIREWEHTCAMLSEQGKPKKEWPKRPKRPCKPRVAEELENGEIDDDQEEGDGGQDEGRDE